VLVLGTWGVLAGPALASTLVVNTRNDTKPSVSGCPGPSGECSLRQAVSKASLDEGIVELPASATPYEVTFGAIPITDSLTIAGAGARTTQIAGNESSEIFEVKASIDSIVTISGVTISHGSSSAGGALFVESSGSSLNLQDVTLSDNTAQYGGAIDLASGYLTVADSTIGPGNVASGGGGGAIENYDGTLRVEDSTVEANSATDGGKGGGISTAGDEGETSLQYATIAFNSASGSGAEGGNLYSKNPGNDPAGFSESATIVADGGAPSGGDCNDNPDGFISEGYNLTDGIEATGKASCGFRESTDLLGDARLGGLADNGGETDTSALAAGSAAIDAIPSAEASCTGTDQRGVSRPQGAGCNIGALEPGGEETAPQWSAAHDFRTSPMENPSPDSLGNAHVWSYEEAPLADLYEPAHYTLMPTSGLGGGCGNLYSWSDDSGVPDVDLNAEDSTITCTTVTVPAHTLVMHPSSSAYSILAWKAPVSEAIDVAGSFTSMDPNGGAGTTWYVDDGTHNLAGGVNPVGGAGDFNLSSLSVSTGETLYFILGPAESGEYTYDTTELALAITAAQAPSAALSLAAQAAPNPVTVGEDLTDTFTITNDGPDESREVELSDPLPEGVKLKSASASQGTCDGTATITCALGSLEDGKQATVKVVLEPTVPGTVSNTATVHSATANPNEESDSQTASAQALSPPPPCVTSMTLDAVQVLAECIAEQGGGTYLASGDTRFSDGARIVIAGTQTPAPLIIDPGAHTITIAPASGGGAQTGELQAGGVDVASGQLTIATQGVRDPVSGISGSAEVNGIASVDLSLSGWTFADLGVTPSVYLAPSGASGGAIVDGQLTLPPWLGSALVFGAFGTVFPANLSGQLAVQTNSSGRESVLNGGISFDSTLFGIPQLRLADGQISYQSAGDVWSGVAMLTWPHVLGVDVNATIGQGKLDDLGVSFSCPAVPTSSSQCAGPPVSGSPTTGLVKPTIGAVLDLKDVSLEMRNLQGISYTPFIFTNPTLIHVCVPFDHRTCPAQPPPPPPPEIEGAVIVTALGERIIAGGSFTDLLDGAFTASGEIGLAPLYGGHFPIPTSTNGLESTLSAAKYGINIASGTVSFTPPDTLTASGTVLLPPEVNFLKGMVNIGIDPPHFTAEGSLNLIVPPGAPILGGDSLGGVAALISDEAAAGEVSASICLPSWLGRHCLTQSLVIAYVFSSGSFHFNLGGNINEYATVAQAASAATAGANRFKVRVPSGRELASFTVHSVKGTPDVELISPTVHGRRLALTLAGSKRHGNHSGALAAVLPSAHEETFLVAMPPSGSWTVRRLKGPKIASVRVSARRKARSLALPHAAPRASDLPKSTISTNGAITLHYNVPNAKPGTTVELWAGTGPHGAGGVMIADGLPASGSATWKLSGLASGRYWPYAIVNESGIPVSIHYWPGSVEVVNPAAPATPSGLEAAYASGQVLVGWNAVAAATSYAITATPSGGGAAVREAVPASQLGDQLTLAPGQWSITVQAVDAEDEAGLPSAASTITVP
jgi:uncharacterized repeat protein (TIGR01451 family)